MPGSGADEAVVVRWWWPSAAVILASTGGGVLIVIEAAVGYAIRPQLLGPLFLAHLVAALLLSAVLGLLGAGRSTRRYSNSSNPFWPGVGYGLSAALMIGIVVGILGASSWAELMPAIGGSLMFVTLLTLELPVMGLLGALVWAALVLRQQRDGGRRQVA
jgi:hypothetical protein